MSQYDEQSGTTTKDTIEIQEPPMYKVLMHNDDYTSMEFVIAVLMQIFDKSEPDATKIMLNVHEKGVGVAGIYTREIAETKVEIVYQLAEQNEFPLRCSMEKE